MSRETYVFRAGAVVHKEFAPALHASNSAPNVIRDGMDETWHPANGKRYESKAAFRKATRAAGCCEVGDQKDFGGRKAPPVLSKERRARDIKTAIEQLRGR